jgi:hypothetical protein
VTVSTCAARDGTEYHDGGWTYLMTIFFLHGWHGSPGSIKPTYLKNHGHTVLNPALPDDNFDEAVRIAQAEFDQHHPDVMVGSSRGDAVAMSLKIDVPLVLLCPAWKRWGTASESHTTMARRFGIW